MKKTALALTLVLALLASSVFRVHVVDVAKANPFWGSPTYPAKPSQEFPTVKIDAPENGEVLETTAAEVVFTVTKPYSWNFYNYYPASNAPHMPVVGSYVVYIYLDGKLCGIKPDPMNIGFPYADYSIVLDSLARGSHNVSVIVAAATYYDDPEHDHFLNLTTGKLTPPLAYPRNITETRQFTINADLPVPSPSPTPTPSPTPKAESFPTTLVTASVSLVAIFGLVLLAYYFKKRQRGQSW